MIIKRLETYTRGQSISLLRLETDSGHVGWGQLSPYNADISAAVLHRQVAPLALGQEIADQEALCERVVTNTYKFPGSYVCRALVALDTAIWDLKGKLEARSVAQMLGATRNAVPAYGSSMRRNITVDEESSRLVRLRDDKGFRAFKLHTGHNLPGGRIRQLAPMDEMVPAVRQAVGEGIDLLVDVNGCYNAEQAIAQRDLLVDHDVCLFEEPCPNWELEWTAEVREAMPMMVAGGEQDYDLKQWERIVAMHCVDLAQPDICYIGGVTRAMQVARMVGEMGMPCIPHSANVSMVTLFAVHMLAAIPNAGPWLEFSIEDTPWAASIFEPALEVVDGMVRVPEGPGWGVDIRQDWLAGAERQVSEMA